MIKHSSVENINLPNDVELEPNEHAVLMVRQHWFVFRDSFLIMFFIPFVLLSGVFFLDYIDMSSLLRNILGVVFLYGSGVMFFLGILMFIWRLYLWYGTYYIITNRRLILVTQRGAFSHDDRETGLINIQDVQASVDGLQASLYGYGNVRIQVSSEDAQLVLEKVGKPRAVQHLIIREAHLKTK
ncbi:PH domain-containing protein [candidate division WWE3 bacterium]|nr:PH domain-containing protein [candidate division WWE3 bacterium]